MKLTTVLEKCWRNRLLFSISPTCYEHFFCKKYKAEKRWSKHFSTIKLLVKCQWNWPQNSILPTFYQQIFRQILFRQKLQHKLQKEKSYTKHLCKKVSRKMLLKLTTGLLFFAAAVVVADVVVFDVQLSVEATSMAFQFFFLEGLKLLE